MKGKLAVLFYFRVIDKDELKNMWKVALEKNIYYKNQEK